MGRSPEHKALEPGAEKIYRLCGKISKEEYHRRLATLFGIPKCCQDYWIMDIYKAAMEDQKIRECPNDYVHCPACREKEKILAFLG